MNNEVKKEFDILAVDDTVTQLKTIVAILTDNGYSVRSAINGALALSAVQNKKPDLILLDITMPGMSGYEATRLIRKKESSGKGQPGETPIIGITASVLKESMPKMLESDCNEYMLKPFHENEVYDVMTKYLGVQFEYEEGVAKK